MNGESLFPWNECPGVKFLSSMVVTCSVLYKLHSFLGVAIPFCIPISNVWVMSLFFILGILVSDISLWFQFAHPKWCRTSLCLFVICISLSVKGLLSVGHFLILFFYCWLLRLLYTFWTLVLYWMCPMQIFCPTL